MRLSGAIVPGLPGHGAALAQLVEHIIRNDGVRCSSHLSGTTLFDNLTGGFSAGGTRETLGGSTGAARCGVSCRRRNRLWNGCAGSRPSARSAAHRPRLDDAVDDRHGEHRKASLRCIVDRALERRHVRFLRHHRPALTSSPLVPASHSRRVGQSMNWATGR
jgi:hypothetical protein